MKWTFLVLAISLLSFGLVVGSDFVLLNSAIAAAGYGVCGHIDDRIK